MSEERKKRVGGTLVGKRIVLGVTGSIAAYKAADLTSKLVQQGAMVDVVMSEGAVNFVTPLTFRSLTHRPVLHQLFDPASDAGIEHVALAENCDAIVVAPATANVMAKAANGLADDLLTCMLLATRRPVVLAPAMDGYMFENPATQENVSKLVGRGWTVIGPGEGRLASGLVGRGRLADVEDIIGGVKQVLGKDGDLAGKSVIVTAGGTQEPIDPVRHIGNRSSGKMGYAIAEAARDRGANVTLVSTQTSLRAPYGVEFVRADTAEEMRKEVVGRAPGADILVMAAAVADYRPATEAEHKIKKSGGGLTLELRETADVLAEAAGDRLVKVGFAAESRDLVDNAREKMRRKGVDLMVANNITDEGSGFGSDANRVVIIDSDGVLDELPLLPKAEVAHLLLDRAAVIEKG